MNDWLLPLAILLCISAASGHLVSIWLLSRMLNPTNLLLISMSGNQLALCVNFLYSSLFKYGSEKLCIRQAWTFGWTFTLLVSVNVSVLVHVLSTFHVVAISIIRHLTLRNLLNLNSSQQWFTYQKCLRSLLAIYVGGILLCVPLYFQSSIVDGNRPAGCQNVTGPANRKDAYRLAFLNNYLLLRLNFWIFGCSAKLIPCVILGVMTYLIVTNLKRVQMMSVRFQTVEREANYHRTTKIILAIMVLFIIVEFPQGVLAIIQFQSDVVGDLFEIFTLFNSCLIFGLLCSMNSRIRTAFIEMCPSLSSVRFQHPNWIVGRKTPNTEALTIHLSTEKEEPNEQYRSLKIKNKKLI